MSPRKTPIEERFWSKVQKTETCWIWTASTRRKGYGGIQHNGKMQSAHRVAWEMEHGPIPQGLHLLHTVCDNPPCVRPDHMRLGTNAENQAERAAKGRTPKTRAGWSPERRARVVATWAAKTRRLACAP